MSKNHPQEQYIPSALFEHAIPVMIPIAYLFGTQTPEEYSSCRQKFLAKQIRENPEYLVHHPIYTCFVDHNGGGCLVIIDGHHRTREAPNQNIHLIPAWVFSVDTIARLYNQTVPNFRSDIEIGVSRTLRRFEREITRNGKTYIPPQTITGARSFQEFSGQVFDQPGRWGIFALPLLRQFIQVDLNQQSRSL